MGSLSEDGFEIVGDVFSPYEVDSLLQELTVFSPGNHHSNKLKAGIRGLLREPSVRNIVASKKLNALLEQRMGKSFFPVRAILFDKTPEANWFVPWHQDITIAVADKVDAVGFGPWSIKADIHHVQPPAEILEKMITVRLHLDDCDETNGALKVLPGSHRGGKLNSQSIDKWKQESAPVLCKATRGSVQLMKPLLLHASSAATVPRHRRVLHIEYASEKLPENLEWFERLH